MILIYPLFIITQLKYNIYCHLLLALVFTHCFGIQCGYDNGKVVMLFYVRLTHQYCQLPNNATLIFVWYS